MIQIPELGWFKNIDPDNKYFFKLAVVASILSIVTKFMFYTVLLLVAYLIISR